MLFRISEFVYGVYTLFSGLGDEKKIKIFFKTGEKHGILQKIPKYLEKEGNFAFSKKNIEFNIEFIVIE